MPKLQLRHQGFTYSTCGPLINIKRIQKFREKSDLNHIYKNKLDKAFCVHDAAYSDGNYR